jgi:hypothetical protein
MRPVATLDLPAGQTVNLNPGRYHIMLLGLKHTLVKGAQVPISLTFADRNRKRFTVETTALVRDLGASADMPMEHNMK